MKSNQTKPNQILIYQILFIHIVTGHKIFISGREFILCLFYFIRHLARINESDRKLEKICAKEGNSIDKQHTQ